MWGVQEQLRVDTQMPYPPSAESPTNPGRINLPRETLGLRRTGFSPVLSLLISASALVAPPPLLPVWLRWRYDAPLPLPTFRRRRAIRSFGTMLEPRFIFGAASLD